MIEELKAFLADNRIDEETWGKSGCDWAVLCAIRADHVTQSQMLSESAALYANLIQKIPGFTQSGGELKIQNIYWRR